MVSDTLFFGEKAFWKKAALLITIPCAILPIMMAASLIMNGIFRPVLFSGDFLLAIPVYGLYSAGLFFSFQAHRNWVPAVLFLLHLLFVLLMVFGLRNEALPFLAIFSVMGTSIVNQYFRTGSPECDESCFQVPLKE